MNAVETEARTAISQYLTFELDKETFATGVSHVQEVLELIRITRIPRMPEYIPGVINVRGSAVPVVNMRLKFGLPETENTVDTCIIVMEISSRNGEEMVIGALVDSVEEVIELEPEQIEEPPKIGTHLNRKFIKGMGKRDERFIIILDIDGIFSSDDITAVKEAVKEMPAHSKTEPMGPQRKVK